MALHFRAGFDCVTSDEISQQEAIVWHRHKQRGKRKWWWWLWRSKRVSFLPVKAGHKANRETTVCEKITSNRLQALFSILRAGAR